MRGGGELVLLDNATKGETTPEGAAVIGTDDGRAGLSPGAHDHC